jgi:hypothetical protein
VVPASQARVATLQGGVVGPVRSAPGTSLGEREEIARVNGPSGVEVLVAPFAGTLLALPVGTGDSLLPGATVAIVGDLSALRIETTDVDEFLVRELRIGQAAEAIVDALDAERPLAGTILSVTLVPQAGPRGDEHYPVVIGLDWRDPAMVPGMRARVRFSRS